MYAISVLLSHNKDGIDVDDESPRDIALQREQCEVGIKDLDCFLYERKEIEWVHRSAYDFVTSCDDLPWDEWMSDEQEILKSMLTGMLRYIAIVPAWDGIGEHDSSFTFPDRLERLFGTVSYIYRDHPTLILSFLDRLYEMLRQFKLEEFDPWEPLLEAYQHMPEKVVGGIAFWTESMLLASCVLQRSAAAMMIQYWKTRFNRWTRDSDGSYWISPLDCWSLLQVGKYNSYTFRDPHASQPNEHRPSDSMSEHSELQHSKSSTSYEDFALALFERVRRAVGTKKTKARQRRTFVFYGDSYVGKLGHVDFLTGLWSITCSWPEQENSSETSTGDAIALFMLIALYTACFLTTFRAMERSETITDTLRELIATLEPAWNIDLEIGTERWYPDRLSIELPSSVWESIYPLVENQAGKANSRWWDWPISIVCFTLPGNKNVTPFWEAQNFSDEDYRTPNVKTDRPSNYEKGDTDMTDATVDSDDDARSNNFNHRFGQPTYIRIEPSLSTKNMVIELLLGGSIERHLSEPYHTIKLESNHKSQLVEVLTSVRKDILNNEQGFSTLRQQSAVACVDEEISRLNSGTS